MDVLRDGTSFQNVANNAEYLIRELHNFCKTQIKGKVKDDVMESIFHLERAFKSDCDKIFKKKHKNCFPSDSNCNKSEEDLVDLRSQVDMLSQAINLLEGNISKATSEPDNAKIKEQIPNIMPDQRKDDCLISNTSIGCTSNLTIDTPTNEMLANVLHKNACAENKELFDESFYLSEEEKRISVLNADEKVCNKDALGNSGDCNVMSSDKNTTIQDINKNTKQLETTNEHQTSNDLDPYNFSEPFFTQDESAFDKCVALLQSVEYNTEIDVEQPKTDLPTPPLNPQNDGNNWAMQQVTSSDEIYMEACESTENKIQEVIPENSEDENNTCPATTQSISLINFPKISAKLSPTISLANLIPSTPNKTFQDAIEINESRKRDESNKETNNCSHSSSSASKTHRGIDRHDVTISDPAVVDDVDCSMMSSPHSDKVVNSTPNADNRSILSVTFPKPNWVLTPSWRVSMNQNIMTKVAHFVAVFNCKLNPQFNFLSTHFIVHKGEKVRQMDFYEALASHRPVVSFEWISESLKAGRMLDCAPYLLNKAPSLYGDEELFDLEDLPILENFQICCIGIFSGFSNDDMRRLVEICGGKYVDDPTFFRRSPKWQNILVVAEDDFCPDYGHQFKRARKDFNRLHVVSKEWLLESIHEGKPLNTEDYVISS